MTRRRTILLAGCAALLLPAAAGPLESTARAQRDGDAQRAVPNGGRRAAPAPLGNLPSLLRWLGRGGGQRPPSARPAPAGGGRPVRARRDTTASPPAARRPERHPARTDLPPRGAFSPSADVGPAPAEAALPPPPATPPPTPFGYRRPFRGCAEGVVLRITPRGRPLSALPLERLPVLGRLWACEWNVENQPGPEAAPLPAARGGWFAVVYEGRFVAHREGTYRFRLRSDDGARLFVDGRLVADADGFHGPRDAVGELPLRRGEHALRLEYLQGPPSGLALRLLVRGPGGREGLLSLRPRRP